jgi:hypothetical protein
MSRFRHAARPLAAVALAVLCGAAGCQRPESEPPAVERASTPWFEERAGAAGLDFVHRSGHRGRILFPEIMGGGAALFDMDGDGDLDAYLVQSGSLHEPGSEMGANRLYVNHGGGRFEDVTEESGAGDRGYGMGVATGDYDNDGDVDLYVTNFGPNALLRNDGGGRFSDVTAEAGVGDASWGTSAAFFDRDNDGDLDLFVANYVDWSLAIEQDCYHPSGSLDYCLPTNYRRPAPDTLYRNNGDGTFSDVSIAAGIHDEPANGLGVLCADFDDDGDSDIFVANDTNMNQMWINSGAGVFTNDALLRGCALDEHGMTKAGMGTEAEDVDDDGDLDLMVVNLEGQTDSFFRNEGGFFADRTGAAGLGATSRRFTRFGLGLVDFDNDGLLDLFQANGRVTATMELSAKDPYSEANLLYRGVGPGRFEELQPRGGTDPILVETSRAAAFGDVDDDGGIDVLVANRDGPAHLLYNLVSDGGHWVRFAALEEHDRHALGGRVSLCLDGRRLTRAVRASDSYCASSDPRTHFGLGETARVESVVVRWPDGVLEGFGEFEANRTHTLRRYAGTPLDSRPGCG